MKASYHRVRIVHSSGGVWDAFSKVDATSLLFRNSSVMSYIQSFLTALAQTSLPWHSSHEGIPYMRKEIQLLACDYICIAVIV